MTGSTHPIPAQPDLPLTFTRQVPAEWADYNGHMNEAFYLVAAAAATDRCLDLLGAGPAYVATGKSFFTVETHIRYLAEVAVSAQLSVTTQVIAAPAKRLHLFHRLWAGLDHPSATVETLLLHTDLSTRRSSQPDASVAEAIAAMASAHSGLLPEGAGRFVGQNSKSQ